MEDGIRVILFKELPFSKHEIEEEVQELLRQVILNVLSTRLSQVTVELNQNSGDHSQYATTKEEIKAIHSVLF